MRAQGFLPESCLERNKEEQSIEEEHTLVTAGNCSCIAGATGLLCPVRDDNKFHPINVAGRHYPGPHRDAPDEILRCSPVRRPIHFRDDC